MCRIISFVSAEGGVGQTSLVFILSKKLSEVGKKVCVVDGAFGYNVLSQKYKLKSEVDFKEFHTFAVMPEEVLNKVNENLFYVKTNDSRYDYNFNGELIQYYINEIKDLFDYILIDVCGEGKSRELFFGVSNEIVFVVSDREEILVNAYKLLSKIKKLKNILSVKVVINKARVIKQMCQKCLLSSEIEEMLKTEVLFVIPKFYKNNYLKVFDYDKKCDKFLNQFCYSIITNKPCIIDYKKYLKSPIGFVRKLVYAKFE